MVTTDLVVRSEPGTGAESEIYPDTLSAPITVYVIDGPVAANGYDWYLVEPVAVDWAPNDLPPAGWVAAAGKDGERWLASVPEGAACDPAPTLDHLVALPPQVRLYCWGGEDLRIEGAADGCPLIADVPWDGTCLVAPGRGMGTPQTLRIAFSTAAAAVPPDGSTISFTGRFGDPSATSCVGAVSGYEGPPQLLTFACRKSFIASEISVVAP